MHSARDRRKNYINETCASSKQFCCRFSLAISPISFAPETVVGLLSFSSLLNCFFYYHYGCAERFWDWGNGKMQWISFIWRHDTSSPVCICPSVCVRVRWHAQLHKHINRFRDGNGFAQRSEFIVSHDTTPRRVQHWRIAYVSVLWCRKLQAGIQRALKFRYGNGRNHGAKQIDINGSPHNPITHLFQRCQPFRRVCEWKTMKDQHRQHNARTAHYARTQDRGNL